MAVDCDGRVPVRTCIACIPRSSSFWLPEPAINSLSLHIPRHTQELDDAIREERYSDAADVRDSTAVGLQGWWAGGPQDDPYGHVLHISRAYGRFVARAYTPSNLAEMKGWTESNPLRQDEGLVPSMPINVRSRPPPVPSRVPALPAAPMCFSCQSTVSAKTAADTSRCWICSWGRP